MERPPKILIVEDDYLQTAFTVPALQNAFRGSEIKQVETELEFRELLEDIATDPPDVIVMDVMLPWTWPEPERIPAPEDVQAGGYHMAGLRCAALLSRYETTKAIPVILYTVLEAADLSQELRDLNNVYVLTKESDFEPLIDRIREVTGRPSSW